MLVLFLCIIVIINDFLYKPLMHKWIYMNQSQIFESYKDLEPLDDILKAERQPSPRNSIFFHETSGEWKKLAFPSIYQSVDERINYARLTFRQACAIESAALHNRKSDIFVLFAASRYMDSALRNESRLKALLHYKNVHFRNVHLWSYTSNTPGYTWLKKGELFTSRCLVSHISDFLRFMTLWRFGGTYLDTDIITLKSLEFLPPNYAGIESKFNVAAGVINFAHDGFGHQLAEKCLTYFLKNYKYNEWNTNGPGVITHVACEICNSTEIRRMPYLRTCKGFHIHDDKLFYAIHYPYWGDFFEPKKTKSVLKQLRQSYIAHFWNKLSADRNFTIGDGCAYDILAQQHCPGHKLPAPGAGLFDQNVLRLVDTGGCVSGFASDYAKSFLQENIYSWRKFTVPLKTADGSKHAVGSRLCTHRCYDVRDFQRKMKDEDHMPDWMVVFDLKLSTQLENMADEQVVT
uniref:Gb3_synth domain-containing protein n=1 Tax=Glossina austeni TaxID=7395 RepID=A0A1A9VX83_GLOAU